MSEKQKKGLRCLHLFSVLLIIIAIMAVLTWIIPAGQYKVDDGGAIIAGSYEAHKTKSSRDLGCLDGSINAMLGKSTN